MIRFEDEGLDLVGILEGNQYWTMNHYGKEALVASGDMSAVESVETIYEWDGKVFRQESSKTVKKKEDFI